MNENKKTDVELAKSLRQQARLLRNSMGDLRTSLEFLAVNMSEAFGGQLGSAEANAYHSFTRAVAQLRQLDEIAISLDYEAETFERDAAKSVVANARAGSDEIADAAE